MKSMKLFSIFCFASTALSMFLPYSKKTGSSFYNSQNVGEIIIDSGIELEEAYVTLIGFVLVILLVHIKQNLATAILSLITGLGLMLYVFPVLAFIITFNIFGPRVDLQLGYFIALLAVLVYFGALIAHLVVVVRNRKKTPKTAESSNLLDDF